MYGPTGPMGRQPFMATLVPQFLCNYVIIYSFICFVCIYIYIEIGNKSNLI